MAQLAIKGHATRGKEVIEILEMLGGNNKTKWNGDDESAMYFIHENGNIKSEDIDYSIMKIFTIEAFLEKFPYKVGDKILYKIYGIYSKIKSMLWNKEKEQVFYRLESNKLFVATADELKTYKEETMEEKLMPRIDLTGYCKDKYIIDLGNYEIKEEKGVIYAVRKQSEYPNTYEECWKILDDIGEEGELFDGATALELFLFDSLLKLKRCRDAYWKIAGYWKPDFTNKEEKKFTILFVGNEIYFSGTYVRNCFLAFPTKEMRDAFYENFKELIESCKELL